MVKCKPVELIRPKLVSGSEARAVIALHLHELDRLLYHIRVHLVGTIPKFEPDYRSGRG